MKTVKLNTPQGRWIVFTSVMASSMALIDGTALNVVLPALQKDLHTNGSGLFWILNAYLLMLASLVLLGGALGDRLGRKKVFILGICLFIVASAGCGISPTTGILVLFRMLQGVGGALMIPGSLSMISSRIDAGQRGRAIGIWSSFSTVFTLGGPVLGGALADSGLWQFIFFINIPIGIIALVTLVYKVEDPGISDVKLPVDYYGALAIVLALAGITFGFLNIPSFGFWNIQSIGPLCFGSAMFAVFIFIQKRSTYPMVPLYLFKNLNFSGINLATFLLYAGLGAAMLFLSLNLVQAQGYSQLQSGFAFLPFTILVMLFSGKIGKLSDRFGSRWFLISGPLAAGAGLFLLSLVGTTDGPADYWQTFFPGITVFGLGMAITVTPLTTTAMSLAGDALAGTASGINNAMARISAVFANAIFGTVAIVTFSLALDVNVKKIELSAPEKKQVLLQARDLGNASPPAILNHQQAELVRHAYIQSFIHSYRIILGASAGLAFLAALTAALMVKPDKSPAREEHP